MKNSRFFNCLGWVALFLLLVTTVITVTINAYPLYWWESNRLNLAATLGLSHTQLLENYNQMMGYLNNPFQTDFNLSDFSHSASGAYHFYEVKQLFQLNYLVLLITLLPGLAFLRHLKRSGGMWRLVRPFQVAAAIPVMVGFVIITSFDWFFVTFHQLFFNNDDWLFDPVTDPIINALPESYFMLCFIFGFLLLEGLLMIGIRQGKK